MTDEQKVMNLLSEVKRRGGPVKDKPIRTFDEWRVELNRLSVAEFRCVRPIAEDTGITHWEKYYILGLTPLQALQADFSE